jgi:glycosyltransferase involved in cell wall biosynthesis/Tfp pilus assembly protein PilF
MRTVAVTPIIGEFGYIVFEVQPRVRAWLRAQNADRRVVFAPQELHSFFEGATEIISPPVEMFPTAPATGRSIVYEYWQPGNPERVKIERLVDWAKSTVQADEWLEIPYFMPTPWTAPATFVKLESPIEVPKEPYVVVAARAREFDSWRNWPASSWDELVRRVRDSWGFNVYAIGRPPSTLFPEGAIPQNVEEADRLEHSIALLNGALFSISSNSGPTHLSLMAGCPTFAWGEPFLKHFMETYTNPLRTPCGFLAAGWDPDVELVWKSLVKWRQSMHGNGAGDSPRPKIRLSMCMIARNSSRTISAALETIRPWVDEMIVLDTGSDDETPQLAEQLGARVFHTKWQDSFSTARNESIRHARGDWIVWIDSDDTIDAENGRKLRDLVESQQSPSTMGFVLQVRCPADPEASAYATATVVDHVKLFRNIPAIQFSGRIHEQVLPAIRTLGCEVEWTDIFVVHSGSEHSDAARASKHRRDLRLLEMSLSESPDDTFHLFNMGMTLLDADRPAEALNFLCRSLQMVSPGESHTRKLFAFLAQAYTSLGRIESALKSCRQGLGIFPNDPELLFRKSSLEQHCGRLDAAEQTLLQLFGPNNSEDRFFSSRDDGLVGVKAWHNLAIIYEKTGRSKMAAAAWEKVLGFRRDNREAVRGLLDALMAAKDLGKMEELAQTGLFTGQEAIIAGARIHALSGRQREAISELSQQLRNSGSVDSLEEVCRISFESGLLDSAETWLRELVRQKPDDPSANLNLGSVYLTRHNYSKAAEYARKSLELRPGYPAAEALLQQARGMLAKAAMAGEKFNPAEII